MTELKEISALLDSKISMQYPTRFRPIVLASWNEVRPEEGLANLFEKLSKKKIISEHPFYFALPSSLVSKFSEKWEEKGFIIGSQSIADDIPAKHGNGGPAVPLKASFSLIDPKEFFTTTAVGMKRVKKTIQHLLDERVPTFVLVAETAKERFDASLFDGLAKEVQALTEGISDDRLDFLSLIYSPSWATIQGMRGLQENFAKSYHLFRSLLAQSMGGKRAEKVRVMGKVPSLNSSFYPCMISCGYEGFYFPNIALYEYSFLKTCEDIEKGDPEFLESKPRAQIT